MLGAVHSCCICTRQATTLSLCGSCAKTATKLPDIVPEQISTTTGGDSNACLVDCWGRIHRLALRTGIGREPEGFGITIHQGSVSRNHAVIEHDAGGTAYLRDLKSTNGTVVANRSVRDTIELVTGDLVFFGSVGFFYVSPVPALPQQNLEMGTYTAPVFEMPARASSEYSDNERTDLNEPRQLKLRIIEATGGGGGFATIDDKQVQVSMVQLELLQLLMKRMVSDRQRPVAVRGYVHSSEILAAVSWDTAHPSDNHVKQLVRRLRRSLARSGRDDLIESQQGLGYRLSVVPI